MRALLLLFVLAAPAAADLLAESQVAGCTDDCVELTSAEKTCPSGQKCTGAHLRHWTHLVEDVDCAVTACAGGTLHFGDGANSSDILVCRGGEWHGNGKKFGKTPAVTCGSKGACGGCSELKTTASCPSGGDCDARLVTRAKHADTGCAIYRCNGGAQLYAHLDGSWLSLDYVDCHLNIFWRLASVRTLAIGKTPELTCALDSDHAKALKALIGAKTLSDDLKNPNVLELLKNQKLLNILAAEKPAEGLKRLIDMDIALG